MSGGKLWIMIGAISGLVSVAMGAFGAHALSQTLSEKAMSVYQTATQYQMAHALALLALGCWSALQPSGSGALAVAGWAFTVGTVLFSGSLYALALTDIRILGAITPFGGLAFLAGWILFAISAWRA